MTERTTKKQYNVVLDRLEALHPESGALFRQLEELVTDRIVEAENKAVRHQGNVIMAAIRGDLVAWPDCQIAWSNREG